MEGRTSPRALQVMDGRKVPVSPSRLPPLSPKHGPDPTSPLLPARKVSNSIADLKISESNSTSAATTATTTTALNIGETTKRCPSPQGRKHPPSPKSAPRGKVSEPDRSADDIRFREELYSPAPWRDDDDDNDDDDCKDDDKNEDEETQAKNSGVSFPAIKVDKCEEGGPSRKNLLPDMFSFGQERRSLSSNCLGVPSPLQQKRVSGGRLVVMTESLRGMRSLSKSEGCLQEAIKASGTPRPKKPLDLDFRPAQMTRPSIRSPAEVGGEEAQRMQGGLSSSPRSLSPVSPLLSPGSSPGHSPFSSPRRARVPPISPKQNVPVVVPTADKH